MANAEHVEVVRQGVQAWNRWRVETGSEPSPVEVDLANADLAGADLAGANLAGARLTKTNLAGADLSAAILSGAHMWFADLSDAQLPGAQLVRADLSWATLSGANLSRSILARARFDGTALDGADLSQAVVYGIAAWDLKGLPANQRDLVITQRDEPVVTVDDLAMAQFMYLMLHNEKIRQVIDTVSASGVLILGRFGEPKPVLDALRNRIRGLGFVPMVFDFEKPEDKHFTGTVRTLAGMSAFIIADITAPRSVQQEAQATIPDYMVPFIPIIEKGEKPWAMFQDLWQQYEAWVRPPLHYGSIEELLPKLRSAVVRPALVMREQLRAQLAKPMPGLSLDDFPEDEDD